jgi:hypothetical protein
MKFVINSKNIMLLGLILCTHILLTSCGTSSSTDAPDAEPSGSEEDSVTEVVIPDPEPEENVLLTSSPISEHYSSEIVFPPLNSDLGGKRSTILRGSIVKVDAETIPQDISDIRVDGKSVEWSIEHKGTWTAAIAVGIEALYLDIEVIYADSTKDTLRHPIRNKPRFTESDLVSFNPLDQKIYSVDTELGEIVSIDRQSMAFEVLNSWPTHSETMFSDLREFKVIPEDNKAYFSDAALKGLFSIDLSSGERLLISSNSEERGTGTDFQEPCAFSLDVNQQAMYVIDCQLNTVFSVDLNTGDRTFISNNQDHSGPELHSPLSIVFESTQNRLIVGDSQLKALVAINIETGERSIFSSSDIGDGPSVESPLSLTLDVENDRILFGNATYYADQGAIISADLETGNRTTISDSSLGEGEKLDAPLTINIIDDQKVIVSDNGSSVPIEIDLMSGDRSPLNLSSLSYSYDTDNSAIDSTSEKLYISSNQVIYEMDKATRSRRVISSDDVGQGVQFGWLKQIAVDEAGGRILAVDSQNKAIIAINLVTGDRSVLSSPQVGTGDNLQVPYDIKLDTQNNRALVLGNAPLSITAVNLSNGDRNILFSSDYNQSDFSNSFEISADGDYAYIAYATTRIIEASLISGALTELHNSEVGSSKSATITLRDNELIVIEKGTGRLAHFNLDNQELETITDYGRDVGVFYSVCSLLLDSDILYSPCGELVAIDPDTGQRVFY